MDKENTNVDEQQKMLTIMNELVELGKKKENVLELSEIEKVFLMMTRPKKFSSIWKIKELLQWCRKVTLRMTLF